MDYSQFKNLLQLKGLDSKESILMLEGVIEKFPYFQSARLLLARAMHEQQNINYNDALKLAAAYSTNREVLRKVINPSNGQMNHVLVEPMIEPASTVSPATPHPSLVTPSDEPFKEYYSEDEISGRAFEEQKEKEK